MGTGKFGYVSTLSGKAVAPPVATAASGSALFDYSQEGKSLHFNLSVKNLRDATAAHIHLGAVGKEGPVVVTLYPFSPSAPWKQGKFSGLL